MTTIDQPLAALHAKTSASHRFGEWADRNSGRIMVLPAVILFFSAQRYFVRGIVMSGIKG